MFANVLKADATMDALITKVRAPYEAKLAENVRAFVDAVSKAKPAGAKGAYLKKVSLSSTMGPGVSLDLASTTA